MCYVTSPGLRKRRPKTTPKNLKLDLDSTTSMKLDQNNHDSSTHSFETTSLDQTNHESTSLIDFDYKKAVQQQYPSQQCPQHLPTKKSVHFFERVIVRPVLHVADYTDEEWQKCWYLPTDKVRRNLEIRQTLRSLQEGKFSGCARGLEKMADKGRTKERRLIAIRDVLDEQETQRTQAKANNQEPIVYDSLKFRMVYRPHSRAARRVAQAMGKIDEMAASPKRQCVRSPKKNTIAFIHANDHGTFLQLDFARN